MRPEAIKKKLYTKGKKNSLPSKMVSPAKPTVKLKELGTF